MESIRGGDATARRVELFIIQLHLSGIATPRGQQKFLNDDLKLAWWEMGAHWHRHFRAKHFTKEGAREYGYAPRTGEGLSGKAFWASYTGRKQRKWGHTNPLEWSGRSKRLTEALDVRPRKDGARVVLHAPALNFYRRNMRAHMWEEMTFVPDSEKAQLAQVFAAAVQKALDKNDIHETATVSF